MQVDDPALLGGEREVLQARLVQTEDLGFITSSPGLQYQADFENLRRWLSFDLLTGRVDAQHPLRSYLRNHGASESMAARWSGFERGK